MQQIAVAIGEELGLSKDRIDALRLGALFHDIGKLAVPDAVLTKPARPDRETSSTRSRSDSEDGARIVGKFGPLRATFRSSGTITSAGTAGAIRTGSPPERSRSKRRSSGSRTRGTR